jgi:hypothetical protein
MILEFHTDYDYYASLCPKDMGDDHFQEMENTLRSLSGTKVGTIISMSKIPEELNFDLRREVEVLNELGEVKVYTFSFFDFSSGMVRIVPSSDEQLLALRKARLLALHMEKIHEAASEEEQEFIDIDEENNPVDYSSAYEGLNLQ